MEYQSKQKYQRYLQHPEEYEGQSNMFWVKKHILKNKNINVLFVDVLILGIINH